MQENELQNEPDREVEAAESSKCAEIPSVKLRSM
jgi:hypothetical protein